jgi:predicted nuclease with TOPRIM domain
MRDTKPLLIVLLSIGLVGTWVYHLYDKTQYSARRTEIFVKDSAAIADAVRDSLMKLYSDTIQAMDTRLVSAESGSATLKNQLDNTFSEMNSLKTQINTILKNRNSNRTDLNRARQMISELQQKVDDLNSSNNSIAEEKDRMNNQMQQLTVQIDQLQKNIQTLSSENVTLSEQIRMASLFVATQLNISAMRIRGNKKEEETTEATSADKFVASFVVQNLMYEYSPAEVLVVVYEPNGQILQNSDWDVESVEAKSQNAAAPAQSTRKFTRRVKFDYVKGEQKKMEFSLHADKFQSGTYIFELWHKGVLIGKVNTTLG